MYTLSASANSCVSGRKAPKLSLTAMLLNSFALAQSRRALAGLTEDQLRDAGITADQARAEAKRPFWDAPAHWKC